MCCTRVQLAHRGASGRFDRGTQVAEWYGLYTEILEQVGWTSERLAFGIPAGRGRSAARQGGAEGDRRCGDAEPVSLLTEALDVLEEMAGATGPSDLQQHHLDEHGRQFPDRRGAALRGRHAGDGPGRFPLHQRRPASAGDGLGRPASALLDGGGAS